MGNLIPSVGEMLDDRRWKRDLKPNGMRKTAKEQLDEHMNKSETFYIYAEGSGGVIDETETKDGDEAGVIGRAWSIKYPDYIIWVHSSHGYTAMKFRNGEAIQKSDDKALDERPESMTDMTKFIYEDFESRDFEAEPLVMTNYEGYGINETLKTVGGETHRYWVVYKDGYDIGTADSLESAKEWIDEQIGKSMKKNVEKGDYDDIFTDDVVDRYDVIVEGNIIGTFDDYDDALGMFEVITVHGLGPKYTGEVQVICRKKSGAEQVELSGMAKAEGDAITYDDDPETKEDAEARAKELGSSYGTAQSDDGSWWVTPAGITSHDAKRAYAESRASGKPAENSAKIAWSVQNKTKKSMKKNSLGYVSAEEYAQMSDEDKYDWYIEAYGYYVQETGTPCRGVITGERGYMAPTYDIDSFDERFKAKYGSIPMKKGKIAKGSQIAIPQNTDGFFTIRDALMEAGYQKVGYGEGALILGRTGDIMPHTGPEIVTMENYEQYINKTSSIVSIMKPNMKKDDRRTVLGTYLERNVIELTPLTDMMFLDKSTGDVWVVAESSDDDSFRGYSINMIDDIDKSSPISKFQPSNSGYRPNGEATEYNGYVIMPVHNMDDEAYFMYAIFNPDGSFKRDGGVTLSEAKGKVDSMSKMQKSSDKLKIRILNGNE